MASFSERAPATCLILSLWLSLFSSHILSHLSSSWSLSDSLRSVWASLWSTWGSLMAKARRLEPLISPSAPGWCPSLVPHSGHPPASYLIMAVDIIVLSTACGAPSPLRPLPLTQGNPYIGLEISP